MTTDKNEGKRLQHLTHSNYEIKDGEPDIRGWDARDSTTKKIGTIKELIFDVQSRKVRYMVVEVDKDYSNDKSHEVLIPIGLAELHNIDNDAMLPGVTPEQIKALPEYDEDSFSSNDEAKIRDVFAGLGVAALSSNTDPDFYNHEHFNEDNLFKNRKPTAAAGDDAATIPIIEEQMNVGKRTVETGGAYIRSRIVERPVEETVNLQEERVFVERTPVDRAVTSNDFDAFTEGEIEMKEHAEVPVVSKEARVVEEVVIGKDLHEHDATIRDTVRKTEVDIEELPATNTNSASSADEHRSSN